MFEVVADTNQCKHTTNITSQAYPMAKHRHVSSTDTKAPKNAGDIKSQSKDTMINMFEVVADTSQCKHTTSITSQAYPMAEHRHVSKVRDMSHKDHPQQI